MSAPRAAAPPGVPGGWRRLLAEVPGALWRALGTRRAGPGPGGAPGGAGLPPWWRWRHVVKLDPDRPLSDAALRQVLACGTDAVVVGGTQGITAAKVLALLDRLQGAPVPVALEVSAPGAAVPGVGTYFIPLVLNAGDPRWLAGDPAAALADLLPRYGPLIPWERMWPAAYLVQNPAAAAAQKTGARPAPPHLAAGYAALAARVWRLPLIYVEYSGTFGDPDLVAAVRRAAGPTCRVWYGGGVDTPDRAAAMARAAHTVVVGNAAHTCPECLPATVAAVRSVPL